MSFVRLNDIIYNIAERSAYNSKCSINVTRKNDHNKLFFEIILPKNSS